MERTGRSWILGMQLRKLRDAQGLTAKYVAEKWLNCSESRIYAIEGGYRRLNVLELRGLVSNAYNRPELLPRMEELLTQVEASSDKPIKDTTTVHPNTMWVHELEPESTAAFGCILDQVPKLAQTYEYMTAQHLMAGFDRNDADGFARAGLERQEKFLRLERPPMTRIIITESSVARAVSIPGQLDLLAERAQHPAISFMMIPNSVGPHFAFSSFTLMEFGEFPAILYLDLVTGGSLVDDEAEIQTARERWSCLQSVTLSPQETAEYIQNHPR